MLIDCRNPAANIAETLRQLYCSSAARFTRGLFFFAKGKDSILSLHIKSTSNHVKVILCKKEKFLLILGNSQRL